MKFDVEFGEVQELKGEDGISPTVAVAEIEGGHRVTITDKDGAKSFDVMDGKDGTPGGGSAEVVLYTEQEPTKEQQKQARKNIDAVSADDVEAIINGGGEQLSITGEVVQLEVDAGTHLAITSKINRDSTWGLSNKLVLHQVSGKNFVDLSAYFGGAGTVFEQNGVTATINENGTLTVQGTNSINGWTPVISKYFWNEESAGEVASRIYPAGTYVIPNGLSITVRAAQYPDHVLIDGVTGNLQGTVTIPEPFRILYIFYPIAPNATVNTTIPFGIFRDAPIPEEYGYSGNIYTVSFSDSVYEGEFNWQTGELKDAEGNTVAQYDAYDIVSLPGTNYFWTGFGEITAVYNAGRTEAQKAQARDDIGAASAAEVAELKTNLHQPWKNRIWSAVGDSLTDKYGSIELNYHDYIAAATGITVINLGYSGSGYAKAGTGSAFHQRITEVDPDSDVVTIFGSFNDYGAGLELGTAADTGTDTICGCINATIDNLLAIMPAVSLGIVTPTPWKSSNPSDENDNHTKYVDALIKICKNRSIPCLDLYRCSNLRPWTEEGRTACYSKDVNTGIHPDETGHKLIASRFKAFLESLII